MKKLIVMTTLLFGLTGSMNANAMAVVDVAANALQAANNAVQTAWQAADSAWQKAKDAFDQSAWGQQAKDMMTSIQKMQTQIEEFLGYRQQFKDTLTGARAVELSDYSNKGTKSVNYSYAERLPNTYVSVSCDADGACASNSHYLGQSSGSNSAAIRDSWRVPKEAISSVHVNRLTHQAAEEYAQQIAVIQAMAQEAYTQANNRIAKISELQSKIAGAAKGGSGTAAGASAGNAANNNATSGSAVNGNAAASENDNDLKYVADLQARIQTEQLLLVNDQNKLSSLAILQQSVRDAYEKRKQEIAAHAINGGDSSLLVYAERAFVGMAQSAAYDAVKKAYKP